MPTRLEQARADANDAAEGGDEVIVRKDTLTALMGLVPLIEGALKWKDPAPKPKATKFEVPAGFMLVPAKVTGKDPKDPKDPTATQLPAEPGDPKPLDPIRGNFEVLLRALNADPTYETGAPFQEGDAAAEGDDADTDTDDAEGEAAEGEGEGATTTRKRKRKN
jgi:hypothetical protein